MYIPLLHSHSGLRWILLAAFITSLVLLFKAAFSGKVSKHLKSSTLITLILTHIQFVLGLALYFNSPKVVFVASSMKDSVLRFYLVEHISMMLIAVILMTIGYSRFKKIADNVRRSKSLFTYYLIALLIILLAIPWPFRINSAAWF